MDAYISKPIRQQELYATIERLLGQKRMIEAGVSIGQVRGELVTD